MHRLISETLDVEWRNSTLHFVLLPELENEYNSFPRVSNEPTSRRVDSQTLFHFATTASKYLGQKI